MAADNITQMQGEAFNIGGGMTNSLSLLELFKILEEIEDVKMIYKKISPRESDQKVFVADTNKLKKFLDWDCNIDKKTGLQMMLSWIKKQ